jgi:hypothetical protein
MAVLFLVLGSHNLGVCFQGTVPPVSRPNIPNHDKIKA